MPIRIALSVPLVAIVWWFVWRMVRPDADNWIVWAMSSDGSEITKSFWVFVMFAATVAIIASLTLFAKKNTYAFIGIALVAYLFANLLGAGMKSIGYPMQTRDFWALFTGLLASYPLLFTDLVRGRQMDVRQTRDQR